MTARPGTGGDLGFDDDVTSAPFSRDIALLQALAADLTTLEYTVDGVEDLLGPSAYAALGTGQLAPALLRSRVLLTGRSASGSDTATVRDPTAGGSTAGNTPTTGNAPTTAAGRATGGDMTARGASTGGDTTARGASTNAGTSEATGDDADPGTSRAVPVLLWLLGETVGERDLQAVFPCVGPHGLERLRLIEPATDAIADEVAGRSWRAAVELRPYGSDVGGNLWVASDLGSEQRPGALRHDHVLGIGGASLTLARTVIRNPVGRALDLGTGCGIQAFHLLQHARHVTATDVSDRALAFARFNLLLNAPALDLDPHRPGERVSLRRGSLLGPVAGERFDLVVSNPPFVITPRSGTGGPEETYTYRDAGLAGDAVVETLIRELPDVLEPGGAAQLLGNWEITEGTQWDRRVRDFVPAGVDAWIIQREQLTPVQYAETWLRDAAENRDREAHLQRFDAYLKDFASREVEGVGFGSVWLRRPRHPRDLVRVTLEEITHEIEQPVGPHLAAAVERGDWLAAHTEQAASGMGIAEEFLLVADDVTEERHQRPGAEHPGVILLRQGAGLRRTSLLSTELAGFVSACDGDLTAGQIAGALAMLLDRSDAAFTSGLLVDVEQLIREGFLIPAA